MADEAIYRCINEACGRPAPRPVNFCPWCGTAQGRSGARAPAAAIPDAAAPRAAAAAAAATAGASAAAALSGWSDAPPPAAPSNPPRPETTAAAPSATEFGRSGKAAAQAAGPAGAAASGSTAGPAAPPPQEVPRPPLAAHPPARRPIRLRWWILALAVLWGVWLMAKPSAKKIDRRIDAAIALAHQCKGSEAQAELIALRKTSATPEQLQRLQQGLNDEAAICTRRRLRAKAWNETSAAAESALAMAAGWDKARSRLQAFIRRWGEDDNTRALQDRIETARREDMMHREHPLAAPQDGSGNQ